MKNVLSAKVHVYTSYYQDFAAIDINI